MVDARVNGSQAGGGDKIRIYECDEEHASPLVRKSFLKCSKHRKESGRMLRKLVVTLVAFCLFPLLLGVGAATAQVKVHKIGRPWEVDGITVPYNGQGAVYERGRIQTPSSTDDGIVSEMNPGFAFPDDGSGPCFSVVSNEFVLERILDVIHFLQL